MTAPNNSAQQVDALVEEAVAALREGDAAAAVDTLKEAAAIAPLREDVRELLALALDEQLSLVDEPKGRKRKRRSRKTARAAEKRAKETKSKRAAQKQEQEMEEEEGSEEGGLQIKIPWLSGGDLSGAIPDRAAPDRDDEEEELAFPEEEPKPLPPPKTKKRLRSRRAPGRGLAGPHRWTRWASIGVALLIVASTGVAAIVFRQQIQTRIKTWIDHSLQVDPEAEKRREFVKHAEELLNEGYYDECVEFIESRRDRSPEMQERIDRILAEAHYQLGEAFFRRERYREAMEHYRSASQTEPQEAQYHHGEGWNYFIIARENRKNGAYDTAFLQRAQRSLEEAIGIDPDKPAYHMSLAHIFIAQDNRQKAVEEYRKVLELAPPDSPEARDAERKIRTLLE